MSVNFASQTLLAHHPPQLKNGKQVLLGSDEWEWGPREGQGECQKPDWKRSQW